MIRSQEIAALYVETDGIYYGLPNVDPWDEKRDARLYSGPWPVVAHPPCQLWVNLAGVNFKRYGGPHNRPGNDGGCFAMALRAVRTWGGVLEHPAGSYAWSTFALPKPCASGWSWADSVVSRHGTRCEHVCEVWQSAYGHKARKRTWLFYSGINPPPELNWLREPGTHQVGWFDRNKPTLGKREARATPIPFRDMLITLAENAAGAPQNQVAG